MKNPGKKNCWQKQKGEINCLQALEGKNKKHKTKVSKSMAESLHSDQAFFASGDQRGASEVSLYNLKTACDTAIRILSRYHLIDTMTLNLLAESKFHFNFFPQSKKNKIK